MQLTPASAGAIGQPFAAIEGELDPAADDRSRTAWATALAIARLDHYAFDAEDEWRMIAGKAGDGRQEEGVLLLLFISLPSNCRPSRPTN